MKINYFKVLITILVLLPSISHTKDFDPPTSECSPESTVKILEAKRYFQTHFKEISFPNSNFFIAQPIDSSEIAPTPLWSKAIYIQGDLFDVVQTPLDNGLDLVALKEIVANDTTIKEITQWFSYLLIARNKKTSATETLVFSIIPDCKWDETYPQGEGLINFNEYVKGDVGDYSGAILVSYPDGCISAGRRFVDGKPTHNIHTDVRASSKKRSKQKSHNSSTFKMCIHGSLDRKTTDKTLSYSLDETEAIGFCKECMEWSEW